MLFADPDGPLAVETLPDELPRDRALRWFGGLSGAAALGWTAPQLCNPKLAARLPRIDAPTLVVWGGRDRLVPVAQADRWRTALRDARLEVVDPGGHALGLEEPAQVGAMAQAFLH